ncbi:MAG: ferrochelatase [Anaerolineae bacterium]|nr:MAG: ferrochelatase [Anaerolineae bacterium]
MASSQDQIGILLMAYGSPEDLADMPAYLLDVRDGRVPGEELIHEITRRYTAIGGLSPLLERTREQARALETELNNRFRNTRRGVKTYVGMRHWQPRIAGAVEEMAADGIRRAIALVMAPHNSMLSIGKYYQALDLALEGREIEFTRITSWHTHSGFLAALAEKLETGLSLFEEETPYAIFTAHSLPTFILDHGDPYDAQLNETAATLASRFSLAQDRWRFCYQSAGASNVPWLGPQIEQVVAELAEQGQRNLLVVPIGFVCDHVEVLYDIDIGARQLAAAHGARLERTPSLNASTAFIRALADLVTEHLGLEVQEP